MMFHFVLKISLYAPRVLIHFISGCCKIKTYFGPKNPQFSHEDFNGSWLFFTYTYIQYEKYYLIYRVLSIPLLHLCSSLYMPPIRVVLHFWKDVLHIRVKFHISFESTNISLKSVKEKKHFWPHSLLHLKSIYQAK